MVIIASLLATARLNDVDPNAWLTQTLERIAVGCEIKKYRRAPALLLAAGCAHRANLSVIAVVTDFLMIATEAGKKLISLGGKMASSQQWQSIPTDRLSFEQFQQFVLPHFTAAAEVRRQTDLFKVFNYILRLLYIGCQWKELPIERDQEGRPEIHYTGIYRAFRQWEADGCFDAVFAGSVLKLHQADLLDITVIHGDGTTTAAKKGGDNIGYSGNKKVKGDKIVAFCDRRCNVIAPFVSAPEP